MAIENVKRRSKKDHGLFVFRNQKSHISAKILPGNDPNAKLSELLGWSLGVRDYKLARDCVFVQRKSIRKAKDLSWFLNSYQEEKLTKYDELPDPARRTEVA